MTQSDLDVKGKQLWTNITERTNTEQEVNEFLDELCKRPSVGLTEVRRDGKDNDAVCRVIKAEYHHSKEEITDVSDFVKHMQQYALACWVGIFLHKNGGVFTKE